MLLIYSKSFIPIIVIVAFLCQPILSIITQNPISITPTGAIVQLTNSDNIKVKQLQTVNTATVFPIVNPECLTTPSIVCSFELNPKTTISSQALTCVLEGDFQDFWLPALQTVYSVSSPPTSGGPTPAVILFNQNSATTMGVIKYNDVALTGSTFNTSDYTDVKLNIPAGTGSFSISAGSSKKFFKYQAPTITSIASGAANTFTITGTNFGTSSSVIVLKWNSVIIPTASINSVDHLKIVFTYSTPYSESVSIDLAVNTTPMVSPFPYQTKPTVTAITNTDYRGGVITLTGTRLNVIKRDGTSSSPRVMIGSTECTNAANPTPNDFTTLTCTAPPGTGSNYDVVVTISTYSTDAPYIKYSYVYPVISSFTHSGTTIILNGTLLGNPANSVITFNGKTITPTATTTPVNGVSQLNFTLPAEAKNGDVSILSLGRLSLPFDIKLTPSITSVSISATAGSTITITGSFLMITNFASAAVPVSFTNSVGGFECKNFVQGPDSTTLLCDASAGVGKDLPATLSIDSQTATSTVSYLAPSMTGLTRNGAKGIIKGTSFGKSADKLQLQIDSDTQPVLTVADTQIEFTLPASPVPTSLLLIVGGQSSNTLLNNFVTSLLAFSTVPTQGGLFSISGDLFNTSAVNVTVWLNQDEEHSSTNYKSPRQCTDAVVTASQIQCQMPNGTGANHVVTVYIDNFKLSNSSISFKYSPPSISSTTSVDQFGGNITILGQNFNSPFEVTIGERKCTNATITDFKTIVCGLEPFKSIEEVPKGKVPMTVNITGQLATLEFEYGVSFINNTQSSENDHSSSDSKINHSENSHGGGSSIGGNSSKETSINASTENLESSKKSSSKAKWLAPVIVIPVVGIAGALGAAAFFMIKKQKKLNEKKKEQFSN
ncbi:hypothetical protein CYY_003306 [Polysphondylium violaceum]|uniref:IPT/TIG domain-containing protein n=1 Tax=Polysphondylium violaceum TaxID=133409 RepID=A0A8J4PXF1_9MYCE|nr:hypothetical protein CYY_003306 [Polysphondylium violaceum]